MACGRRSDSGGAAECGTSSPSKQQEHDDVLAADHLPLSAYGVYASLSTEPIPLRSESPDQPSLKNHERHLQQSPAETPNPAPPVTPRRLTQWYDMADHGVEGASGD